MTAHEALAYALEGTPVSHKDFKNPSRFIVCTETNAGLELVDSESDTPAFWGYLVDHYGNLGWRKHKLQITAEITEADVHIDLEYLSTQIDDLYEAITENTDLLTKVLTLAGAND